MLLVWSYGPYISSTPDDSIGPCTIYLDVVVLKKIGLDLLTIPG